MTRITLRQGFVAVALFASNVALSGLGYHGSYSTETALAASTVAAFLPTTNARVFLSCAPNARTRTHRQVLPTAILSS
jgi:hypothetical protein